MSAYRNALRIKKMDYAAQNFASAHTAAFMFNSNSKKGTAPRSAADFNPFMESDLPQIHEDTAREFFRLTREKKLPSWVVGVVNIPVLRKIAGKEAPEMSGV